MKKPIVIAIILFVMAAVACAPTPAATGGRTPAAAPTNAGGVTQITFWHAQGQAQETALNKLVDQFNTAHPNIHVTAVFQGNYDDLYKKVTAAIAAKTPPDLAIAYSDQVANYIKSNAVVPLDDLMKDPQIGFSAADLQDVYPAFVDHYPQAGNKVYSVAFMRSMEVMFYNADLLQSAGFSQPPATWDDFDKMCAAVSKAPTVYCHELNPDASRFSNMVFSRGGTLLSPDGTQVAFDGPAGLAALQSIDTLFKNHQAILIAKAFQDQTDFSLGKIAFTFGSSAGVPYYDQAIKDTGKTLHWGIAPYPHSTPNPVVDVYGPSVTVFATTPEKERAAFTFIKWMMDTGPNADWVKATGYFPARQSTRGALADYIKSNPIYGQALGWLQYGETEPSVAAWEPIRGFIADAMTAVANGKATPADALKTAADKANAALKAQ